MNKIDEQGACSIISIIISIAYQDESNFDDETYGGFDNEPLNDTETEFEVFFAITIEC